MNSRPAPPPPPYGSQVIYRVTRQKSLRGIVLFCVTVSFIWSLAVGVDYIREAGKEGNSGRFKTALIVQGAMFFALASLETVGFHTAWKQDAKSGRFYVMATILGGVLMTATEVTRMALHFVFKDDIKAACAAQEAGEGTADEITRWCDKDFQNGIWRDAAWLVFGVICSVLMYVLSKAYYHQLLDPNYGKQTAASDRFRMNAMNTPYNQDQGFMPPYSASGQPQYAPGYTEASQPPMYDGPSRGYGDKEGFTSIDIKRTGSMEYNDVKTGHEEDDRDLTSRVEHLERQESDTTLPGRQGEGRV